MTPPILQDVPENIETERLWLRIPRAGWGEKVHEAIMDGYEDYVRWLNWSPTPPSLEQVEIDCRAQHARFILREELRYLIIEKKSDHVIGRCGLPAIQALWVIPQFGLSYFVRKSARGYGYAAEAAHALATMAFKVLKAKKVEIYADADNHFSRKIPETLNFTLECQKKGGWPRQDGALADLLTYALFSEENLPSYKVQW
ncbi:MAG: GNAT family N-acetyltransferase [Proteobacteria bacterium]|nr:GNAT family N-acetyltransferase [Pseudomonadota bacterium]